MNHLLRVLIAEDNLDDAELIVREVRSAGFDPKWRRVDTEVARLELAPLFVRGVSDAI